MIDIEKLEKLMEIIKNSSSIVFFGGAGVSTASNIPDFRGSNGIYKYSPEEIISHSFFINNTKEFYEFYFEKLVYKDALPNECHKFLKKLEDDNKIDAIITQNIDNLHQKAGSSKVIELHGSIFRNYCMKCKQFYDLNDNIFKNCGYKNVPLCECGGIVKPDVVLYEENLNERDIIDAINYISNCDTLIIGGTSLVVYPAASFVRYFKGKNLVVINLGDKLKVNGVDLYINGKIEDYLNTLNYEKYLK